MSEKHREQRAEQVAAAIPSQDTSPGIDGQHAHASVQARADSGGASVFHGGTRAAAVEGSRSIIQDMVTQFRDGDVQAKGALDADGVHEAAAAGLSGSPGSLPHLATIQSSFGRHDVSNIQAHGGSEASAANDRMGSQAYASGTSVAFKGSPDLHTAAHEAAHVIQQRGGVQLKDGIGRSGDAYEQHADAVADAVVQGKSAEGLLDQYAPSSGGAHGIQGAGLQFLGTPLTEQLPEGAEKPAFGMDSEGIGGMHSGRTSQRRYSPEQYRAMWEKEQGRKMTTAEWRTVLRGCIGITAVNLAGGGNPLDLAEATYASFELAEADMKKRNADLAEAGEDATGTGSYVLFAKLFWSNQGANPEKPDDDAFLPDPKTGKIDMSGYRYQGQPKFINFDYGFWDEASQCFWHANHARTSSDPKEEAKKPMKVYQSTKERFARGYIDFDRIVFCVARTHNYNPALAAMAHAGSGS